MDTVLEAVGVAVINCKKSDAVIALMGAASTLPGIAQAEQGFRSDKINYSQNHSTYSESGDRMDVNADQITVTVPVLENFELKYNHIRDLTSGASPVMNLLGTPDNSPFQVLHAGATIEDKRKVNDATITYYGGNTIYGMNAGTSEEDDYTSRFLSLDYSLFTNNKNTTWSVGIARANDDVWNFYEPDNILNEPTSYHERSKNDYLVGITQVLDKHSVLQWNLTYSSSKGFLSDPYKKTVIADEAGNIEGVDFFDLVNSERFDSLSDILATLNKSGLSRELNVSFLPAVIEYLNELGLDGELLEVTQLSKLLFGAVNETRPDNRSVIISALQYRRFFDTLDGAMHLSYRFSDDSWETNSHTVEVAWAQNFGSKWMFSPSLRFYSQHSAYFYQPYFETRPEDGLFSSDYRLAGFGALSRKLEVHYTFSSKLSFTANYEYYDRRYGFELGEGSVGVSLDDYTYSLASFSFAYNF